MTGLQINDFYNDPIKLQEALDGWKNKKKPTEKLPVSYRRTQEIIKKAIQEAHLSPETHRKAVKHQNVYSLLFLINPLSTISDIHSVVATYRRVFKDLAPVEQFKDDPRALRNAYESWKKYNGLSPSLPGVDHKISMTIETIVQAASSRLDIHQETLKEPSVSRRLSKMMSAGTSYSFLLAINSYLTLFHYTAEGRLD